MSDCCDSSDVNVFDVAVIGAGSAGFSAAITAADEGARVALIGYDTIGGTCVNVGCVPSKTLIRAAESLHNAAASKRFDGIEVSASVSDWSEVVAQKQALVDELRQAKYVDVLPSYNTIAYKEGKASFTENGDLTVDGELLDAGKIIIATGSKPHIPAIPGIDSIPYRTGAVARIAFGHWRGLQRCGNRTNLCTSRRRRNDREPARDITRGGARDQFGANRVFSGRRHTRTHVQCL